MLDEKKILCVNRSVVKGKIVLSGAKNSALKLQTASILTDDDVIIDNFPNYLSDIDIHSRMLVNLGKKVEAKDDIIKIKGSTQNSELIWQDRSIRNTLLMCGAILSKTGYAKVPLPGGCKIGERKYDLHQMVLEKLGAIVWNEDEYICASSKGRLKGADIYLPLRSTGATENAIISSTLADGITTIWNPHIRPEILDLIDFLKKMGANITVRGNESIIIKGVETLHGATHKVIPDNMEALTYLVAASITGGELEIENFPIKHLEVPLIFLTSSGVQIFQGPNSLIVKESVCYPLEISTGPYPGINSDMQPILAVFSACAKGMSKIVDLRFPDRFGYVEQLKKMGVDGTVHHNQLVINGGNPIYGTDVYADDLRAGAALLLAGLVAEGQTKIYNAEQIERGYENIVSKFASIGVKICFSN